MYLVNRNLCCSRMCLHYRGCAAPVTYLHHRGLSCTCVYTARAWAVSGCTKSTGTFVAPECVCITEAVLHLWQAASVSTQQGLELYLDVPSQQEPMLLQNVSALQRLCCTCDISTSQGTKLHLEAPGQQETVLLLDVPLLRGLSCTSTLVFNLKKNYFEYLQC